MEHLQKIKVGKVVWLFSLLMMLFIGVGNSKAVRASDAVPPSVEMICRDWPMPTGYVIVGVQDSQSCLGSAQGVQFTVSLPSEGLTVCNNQSIPAPYVVTTLAPSQKCNGLYYEGVIRSVADGVAVCGNAFSPIPAGYVITSVSNNDAATCMGVPIFRLSPAGDGVAICNVSPKPSGYVISHVINNGQCVGANSYVLQTFSEGMAACSFSPAPEGHVVTAGQATNSCTDGALKGDYWTFSQPYSGVVVCPFSPIPSGYYNTGQAPKANCYGASYGIVLKML